MQLFSLGKLPLVKHKSTARCKAESIEPPGTVYLPMSQHIGKPAVPTVKAGDSVLVGSLIGDADGYLSAPVHSSVSGTVKAVDKYLCHDGTHTPMVVIESDGLMRRDERLTAPTLTDIRSLSLAARDGGIVGLGGAGFPTGVKLDPSKLASVDTLIVNAAECEPYITSDTRTMIEDGESVVGGVELILRFCDIQAVVIAIEADNSEAIRKMSAAFSDNRKARVKILPTRYPQGAERVLVYNCTRRVIPKGRYPYDVGVLVMNVTTLSALYNYVKTGLPLVEKTVTLSGSAIKNPGNFRVPIGTPISDLITAAGGTVSSIGKILYGGPMTGIAVYSDNAPILKYTNAVTVISEREAKPREKFPCINCGRCLAACPVGLDPTLYAKALNLDDPAMRAVNFERAELDLCFECGCCSYVCPSARPLVEMNRLAKLDLKKYRFSQKLKSN